MIEANIMLTFPVSIDCAIDTFFLSNTKVRSPVKKSCKINGFSQKIGVTYHTRIYMMNNQNFKIGLFFKLTLVKYEYRKL